jgi:hypothetical protein
MNLRHVGYFERDPTHSASKRRENNRTPPSPESFGCLTKPFVPKSN